MATTYYSSVLDKEAHTNMLHLGKGYVWPLLPISVEVAVSKWDSGLLAVATIAAARTLGPLNHCCSLGWCHLGRTEGLMGGG